LKGSSDNEFTYVGSVVIAIMTDQRASEPYMVESVNALPTVMVGDELIARGYDVDQEKVECAIVPSADILVSS
jgi:hypothetical protein